MRHRSTALLLAVLIACGAPSASSQERETGAPPEPPIRALSAALDVRYEARFDVRDERVRVRRPVVELGDEARTQDLDLRIRSQIARYALGAPGFVSGGCRATLATAELVSVLCDWTTRDGSRTEHEAWAITFRMTSRGPQRVEVEEAFAPGAQIRYAVCAAALRRAPTLDDMCSSMRVALGPDRLIGSWPTRGRRGLRAAELPYAELASLVRHEGFLAFAAGEAPATPTPALAAAAPEPRTCWTYGAAAGPVVIGEAVIRSGIDHIYLSAVDAGEGRFWLSTPNRRDVRPEQVSVLEGAIGARADTLCGHRDATLWRHVTTGELALAAAPNGSLVATVPSGARLVVFDGVVEGRDSMVDASVEGLWSYVVAEGAHGWARLSGLTRSQP